MRAVLCIIANLAADVRVGSFASFWWSADYFRSSPGNALETDIVRAGRHVSRCHNGTFRPVLSVQWSTLQNTRRISAHTVLGLIRHDRGDDDRDHRLVAERRARTI